MAEQQKLQKEGSARTDEGAAGGQNSKYILLPEKLKSLCQKVDSGLGLLQRMNQPASGPLRSKQHELTLLERTLQEFKAELNQMQHSLNTLKTEPLCPCSLAELNPVSDEANSQEMEQKSTQDALQQAEQLIKYQREQLELKESTQRRDAELSNASIIQYEPSKGNSADPSNSHATSVMVGRGNTAVIQSTINIINIGENSGQGDNVDFCEILKSISFPHMLSVKEGPQKRAGSKISSGGATPNITRKKPRLEEKLESTNQYQGNQCSRSDTDKEITVTRSWSSKPLVEKKRRARINASLTQLKTLIFEATNIDTCCSPTVEKVDILERTVKYLKHSRKQCSAENLLPQSI